MAISAERLCSARHSDTIRIMAVCGIDEAGRGPLAGPVTAAAVILPEDFPSERVRDSKKLSPERREEARAFICTRATAWGIGWAWHFEIDALNIHHASLLAMSRAFTVMRGLGLEHPGELYAARGGLAPAVTPDRALVDGRHTPQLSVPAEAVVHGDATVPEIEAASILAKTARDAWMVDYAEIEPQYRFERHKGYPTPEHRKLIEEYGPSRIHRYSFRKNKA
jgi:ribonuclease HII